MKRPVAKRGTVLAVGLAAVAVAGGSTAFALFTPAGGDGTPRNAKLPPSTVAVERGDLSETTHVDGTIGYAGKRKINAGTAGTLTRTAGAGSVVRRNGLLYAVDGRSVRLMYGSEPMYRTLKEGAKGKDVKQLEENLAALGYTGFTVDDEYTGLTAAAVKRWQKANSEKQTGTVGPELVAFEPGAVRVESAEGSVGDLAAPGRPVLDTTGSERVVSMKVDVADSSSVKQRGKVTVALPDGTSVPGKVRSVGTSAAKGSGSDDSAEVTVTVSLDEPSKADTLDQAPVTVVLTGRIRKNVLTVPVEALLARPQGGFCVQVVEHGRSREVRVDPGLFSHGRVEVGGGGLRAGMKVGVPKI